LNRSQRRVHFAVWAVLVVVIAATIAAALTVDAHVGRAAKAPPATGVR
jgi:hypothetical protein